MDKIPEYWRETNLNQFVDEFIVPMRDKPKSFKGGTPWCRIEDFNGIYLHTSKSGRYVDQETINAMSLKVYPVGTVLCSCSADLGKCAITATPLVTNQTFIGLVAGEDLDNLFLYYFLTFNAKRLQRLSSGTTIAYLSRREFENLSIILPSDIREQRKIAEILSTWDKAIELVSKQIRSKKKLKKGLMQQLLTGKVRFPRFGKPAAEGELPEGWQEVRMNELGEHYSGLSGKSKNDFGAGKPYIPYLNIFQNNVVNSQMMDYVQVTDGENQNLVKQGDVFFTLSSETPEEVGMSSVLLENIGECYLNSFCMGFRLSNNDFLLPDYAVNLFRGPVFRRDIYKYAQGSTRFNLSKRGFLKMTINIPSIPEQRKISEFFSTIDLKISKLVRKVGTLRTQKQGLMQKLLTGEVRVTV